MIEIGYEEMHKAIEAGQRALQYAWDNYDDLAGRIAAYTLYGPYSTFLGAAFPWHTVAQRARKLLKKTRREEYFQYEFDEAFRLIRVLHVNSYEPIHCTYHVFEMDGVIYGCLFNGCEKHIYTDRVEAMILENNKPVCCYGVAPYAFIGEFFQYPTEKTRIRTEYFYTPRSERGVDGLPVNRNAPFNAPGSPVSVMVFEDTPVYLDYKQWCID